MKTATIVLTLNEAELAYTILAVKNQLSAYSKAEQESSVGLAHVKLLRKYIRRYSSLARQL